MHAVLNWRWSAVAGVSLAAVYAASPLFVGALALAGILVATAGRDLEPAQRRQLLIILGVAIAARFAFIAAVLVSGIPVLNDLSVGALRGDDAYYLGRAIRARDIALGLTHTRYDYFIVSDEYGRTSYLHGLTLLQTLFGPSPYGMRAINAVLFVSGACLLFRLARQAFGWTPAALGLTAIVFMPSLFVASTSLLKESVYFLATAVLLTMVVSAARQPRVAGKVAAIVAAAVCLWMLDDLRRGALVLAAAGIGATVVLLVTFKSAGRAVVAGAAVAIVAAVAWFHPVLHQRVIDAVASAAKTHAGHVFTTGHAYKLLDDGFYTHVSTPSGWQLDLTDGQAARFVIRAVRTFLLIPLPWEMMSRSEVAFLPEHLLWLLIVAFTPIGIIEGWRRDRLVTALLLGFVLPTAAALAVTNGNVGTLLRLRGLVSPYLIWLAILGALSASESLLARREAGALT